MIMMNNNASPHDRKQLEELEGLQGEEKLQKMVNMLWMLLDDIDTLDDACRGDDSRFRKRAYQVQQKRHDIVGSDGYRLILKTNNPK